MNTILVRPNKNIEIFDSHAPLSREKDSCLMHAWADLSLHILWDSLTSFIYRRLFSASFSDLPKHS